MSKKIALVTGASSGIGLAVAQKLEQEGYEVIAHSRALANLENETAIEKMFADIEHLDLLVNNAGTASRKKIEECSAEDFQRTFMVNTTAPFLCAREAYNRGATAIVNIGSMRGLSHQATTPDYSASKAALHNLTVSLARAFAPRCRVNCVAPGFTKTPLHTGKEERLKKEAALTPLQMFAEAEDIAEAVAFLADNKKARFITGELLVVDGGRSWA